MIKAFASWLFWLRRIAAALAWASDNLVLNATATAGHATVFIHIQTRGRSVLAECWFDCVRLYNEAKSPSPGISCLDGGTLVSGPEFHPHVVCQGLIWETRTGDGELGHEEVVWQRQHAPVFLRVERKDVGSPLCGANSHFYSNCTGFTTFERTETKKRGFTLFLFPFSDLTPASQRS